jgi:hypothetical protein
MEQRGNGIEPNVRIKFLLYIKRISYIALFHCCFRLKQARNSLHHLWFHELVSVHRDSQESLDNPVCQIPPVGSSDLGRNENMHSPFASRAGNCFVR